MPLRQGRIGIPSSVRACRILPAEPGVWERTTRVDWYPHYIKSYRRKTLHLTTLEHGAYRLLIDAYMLHGQALPNNDNVLAKIAGISDTEWLAIATTIRAFFTSSGTILKHKRCEHELSEQMQQRKSWSKNKTNNSPL